MSAGHELDTAKIHLSLNVADLDRSVRFYSALLGAEPHKRRPGYANFSLEAPPLKLALNEHPPTPGPGALNHLGFQVPSRDHVTAAQARLRQAGLDTSEETDTVCCHARQDKVWVQDPDGNAWEVYVIQDDLLEFDGEAPAATPRELAFPACHCGC